MRRKEGGFRLYAVQLPELLRRCPGLLAENRDKVADIAVAAEGGDAVERSVGTADESSLARLMRRTLMYERTELPTKRWNRRVRYCGVIWSCSARASTLSGSER